MAVYGQLLKYKDKYFRAWGAEVLEEVNKRELKHFKETGKELFARPTADECTGNKNVEHIQNNTVFFEEIDLKKGFETLMKIEEESANKT